ncbi:DNA phosphorothioation system sulfurtransferase DndC [Anaeromicrobium sediminis]|uniref:Sulfurtransferase DndC n=1 Tax=Anaeromicrobium sediminis TaxID=1478221 RepID=A0A267MM82_9FIRM|nr:DNA phosphorothioation system sulfurtransferase DndC [Anaeromicrobium sediminis]PAB60537.1 sulfurtransferase DndC [Anaeromicrobium sediminis]
MIPSFFKENTLDDLYKEMTMVYLNDNRPWIIGYSGGKDSTVVVELVYHMLLSLPEEKRHKNVYVVSSDTLIENPIILNNLNENMRLINVSAKKDRIPMIAEIVIPHVNDTFWVNVIGRGYPTPKSIMYRWCTERLKIRPSNKFISAHLKNEDVVVLLGVRKDESISRKQRIENKQIDGYLLTPHETLKNDMNRAYVYTPIVDFTTDDVWEILLNQYMGLTPWGSNNIDLFKLYSKGSGYEGECPFVTDSGNTNTCGNSRFGCWICTVVKEDKSLNGFIRSEPWLLPLAQFRRWIMSIRNESQYRRSYKRNGSVQRMKDGTVIYGPFTFEARQEILNKLLETQKIIQRTHPEVTLITLDELKKIDEIWDDEEDLTRQTLVKLYENVVGKKLPWHDYKKTLFDEVALTTIKDLCDESNIDYPLLKALLIQTDKYKHYGNPSKMKKSVEKLLNQGWVHDEIIQQAEQEKEESTKEQYNVTKES